VHTTTEDSNNSALLADSRRVTLNDLNASTKMFLASLLTASLYHIFLTTKFDITPAIQIRTRSPAAHSAL